MRSVNQLRRVSTSVVVAIAGATIGTNAMGQPQGGVQGAQPVRLSVTQNGFGSAYLVNTPGAASSAAKRLLAVGSPPQPGYTVHNKVVVKSDDLDLVRKVAVLPGNAVRMSAPAVYAAEGLIGWTVIETGTVAEAVALAERLSSLDLFESVSVEIDAPRQNRDLPNDPLVDDQWHIQNDADPDADLNLSAVYGLGVTGMGVTVGILEGGDENFEVGHPDLAANWDPSLSMSTTPFIADESHATAVAGLIGAVGDNGIGVAGVAYDAKLARLRNGTPLVRAQAFHWWNTRIAVKNNSWGPSNFPFFQIRAWQDADYVMDALDRTGRYGRGGKGVVTVWASGNEGQYGELLTGVVGAPGARADYEPWTSSRYTIAVGAVGEDNNLAAYSAGGTSLFCTAYSAGDAGRGIVTTTSGEGYTNGFGGTSASSPIVAGVIALMLDANPNLTLRDVQHIIADTSRPLNFAPGGLYFPPFGGDTWWQVNGAYTRHSDEYGFGLIDAEAAVNAALSWTPVSPLVLLDTYTIPGVGELDEAEFEEIPEESGEWYITATEVSTTFCVKPNIRMEHVEVEVVIDGEWQGDLTLTLTSPWGTLSPLALTRPDPAGGDNTGYSIGQLFTTLKHWDEESAGIWTIAATDFIPGEGPFDGYDDDNFVSLNLAPWFYDGIEAEQKDFVSYRVKIYGTDVGSSDFFLCDPLAQSCPGDLNGDGVTDVDDFMLFLSLYHAGDLFADLNDDGNVNYADLQLFFQLWIPGYCDSADTDGPGGRPMPGGGGNGQPIGPGPGGV